MTTFPKTSVDSEDCRRSSRLKSPIELAFLGDAVYELLVRSYISSRVDAGPGKLHALSVNYVRAEAQAKTLEMLMPILEPEEADVVRRGKNSSKMSVPRHADPRDYRYATGLEALFGYLYMTHNESRIEELFSVIVKNDPV